MPYSRHHHHPENPHENARAVRRGPDDAPGAPARGALSRRALLRGSALAALGVAVPVGTSLSAKAASRLPATQMPRPYQRTFTRPPPLAPIATDTSAGVTTTTFRVSAREGLAGISPTVPTRVWGYDGLAPGPMVSVEQGSPSVLRVRNRLPQTHPLFGHPFRLSTHLHGSASKPQYDGYANDLTPPGFVKDYRYPNAQCARTIWYHDHAVHDTAFNVYGGLAAPYVVHDPLERAMLPQGEFDVPLVVSDCILGPTGDLLYADNSHSGLFGDIVLVNGVPWPVMRVKRRIYRFRVLTATLARSFRFRLGSGAPVWVVATDGGLMPAAQQVTSWRQAPAERYEVLVDFRGLAPGTSVELRNLSNKNNVDYADTGRVMRFDVVADGGTDEGTTLDRVPDVLAPENEVMTLSATSATRVRRFDLKRRHGQWTVNGETWDDVVASGFQRVQADPGLGDVEVWELVNSAGGWFHPVHIHLVDFRILSRNGRPPSPWERGPKDVVYLGENETVRVLVRFGPHEGRYMIHCHNLPHEDHDMMTQFRVGPVRSPDADDPVAADPCRPDAETD